MTRALSLYLDLVRFVAAFAVFVSHASRERWSGGLLWELRPLGSDAVAVFFVLSGFVVTYAAMERERSGRIYAVNRLARLHSGVVPAILLTFAADAIGRAINPAFYDSYAAFHSDHLLWQGMNALFFTHELWWNDIQLGTNIPYWSVGYEALYYLAFGLLLFAPKGWRLAGAGAAVLLAGPDIGMLAPMWIVGAGAYLVTRRAKLGPRAGLLVWGASLAWVTAVVMPTRLHSELYTPMTGDPIYWWSLVEHYYPLSIAFSLNLIGFQAASPLFAATLERVARPVRWLGGRTFALYLMHMPLMQLAAAASPWPASSWATRAMVFVGVPLLIVPLADVSERRKGAWRSFYERILPGARPGLEPPPAAG